MLNGRYIVVAMLVLASVLTCDVSAQQPLSPVGVPAESGLKPTKSRWYRHVIMGSIPGMGAATATMGVPASPMIGSGSPSRRGFMYEVTIRNESEREVKGIHWDHVFIDPKDGSEMRRFHFIDDRRSISKGKSVTYSRMSSYPPSGTIDAAALEKDAGPQYLERIDIKCVLYKGNVFWYAANATLGECAYLMKKLKTNKK